MDTMTLDRDVDVYLGGSSSRPVVEDGVDFSTPYAHAGAVADGMSEYVECVDRMDSFFGSCRDLVICIRAFALEERTLTKSLPGAELVPVPWNRSLYTGIVDGECNVAIQMGLVVSEDACRKAGFKGNYSRGVNAFSRDPLAMILKSNEPEWRDFCEWVLQGLFWAEAQNINDTNIDDISFPSVLPFCNNNITLNLTAAILAAGGNYDDGVISTPYVINGEVVFPGGVRTPPNALNLEKTTGLIYSTPLGVVDEAGREPIKGGTIDRIYRRGYLRCGVAVQEDGFASRTNQNISSMTNPTNLSDANQWDGLDVEICRSLSAAIFRPGTSQDISMRIISFPSTEDSFVALASDEIDVLAGGPASYETDVLEPTSRAGFTLSMPYFYGDINFKTGYGDVRTLLTREDDPQWSGFYYWIINALVLAEEEGWTQSTANEMPVVRLFGERHKQMFRDAVFASGNYGEIYTRTLEQYIPRQGWNLLNTNPIGPQQLPMPFFWKRN